MGLSGNRLVVGTTDRHVIIYDVRSLSQPEQRRESSLMNQTRIIRGFPDTTGYALGSIEGRVAVEYFNPDPNVQKNKYAFKCHRKTVGKTQVLYPINAMAFHPKYGTFATGGCDGIVNVWDGANKKRICLYPTYATSISALNFNSTGDKLAVAASYTWEEGDKESVVYLTSLHDACIVGAQLLTRSCSCSFPAIPPTRSTFARCTSRTCFRSKDQREHQRRHRKGSRGRKMAQ
jgi:cell cycle arrest protein BUB3